ncbi:MAG: hypothetical protein AMXMBFR81_28680 [Chthonomonas sp.]|nr:hypothetical protein [Fimbriimonadaceae bacterium]
MSDKQLNWIVFGSAALVFVIATVVMAFTRPTVSKPAAPTAVPTDTVPEPAANVTMSNALPGGSARAGGSGAGAGGMRRGAGGRMAMGG